MHDPTSQGIIIFIAGITLLLLLFISFIVTIVYKYQQKQNAYFKDIESLKTSHQNTLLQSQLEIQEQTFQHISREIHDNIGQKLSLAQLHLNTLSYTDIANTREQVSETVSIISEAIKELSDLSHSLSSEVIMNNGLIKALEYETAQLQRAGKYKIHFSISGNPVFMDANTELVLFRISQEALNNIIRHAGATRIDMHLYYNSDSLVLTIEDNGKGFHNSGSEAGTGLLNMKKRTLLLNGKFWISSAENSGTQLKIEIPLYANNANA